MSERVTVTNGTWQNIGTGPATVQLLSPDATGAEVMVVCATAQPTGSDGMVLSASYPQHDFQLAQAIWAQVIQTGLTALVAVQPE